MPRFHLIWKEEITYETYIDTFSEEEAKEILLAGEEESSVINRSLQEIVSVKQCDPKQILSQERAKEAFEKAKEDPMFGPWCDKIDKYLTKEERDYVTSVLLSNFSKVTYTWMDMFLNIMNGRENPKLGE